MLVAAACVFAQQLTSFGGDFRGRVRVCPNTRAWGSAAGKLRHRGPAGRAEPGQVYHTLRCGPEPAGAVRPETRTGDGAGPGAGHLSVYSSASWPGDSTEPPPEPPRESPTESQWLRRWLRRCLRRYSRRSHRPGLERRPVARPHTEPGHARTLSLSMLRVCDTLSMHTRTRVLGGGTWRVCGHGWRRRAAVSRGRLLLLVYGGV